MNKFTTLSNRLNLFAGAIFYSWPIITAYLWFHLDALPQDILGLLLPFNATLVASAGEISAPLASGYYIVVSPLTKLIGFSLSLLPLSVMLLALHKIRILLTHYANGNVFTLENTLIYRSLALLLFASCLVDMVYIPLTSVGLTMWNPEGYRVLMASFGTSQVQTLFIASLVWLISWVMHEAFTMAEEQAAIV